MDDVEVYTYAKKIRAPPQLVRQTKTLGRLPVVNFAAGGVATPADAALMMQLGMDGVFVGSGIFKSGEPAKRARAIVQAVTHYNDPKILAEVSQGSARRMVDRLQGDALHLLRRALGVSSRVAEDRECLFVMHDSL